MRPGLGPGSASSSSAARSWEVSATNSRLSSEASTALMSPTRADKASGTARSRSSTSLRTPTPTPPKVPAPTVDLVPKGSSLGVSFSPSGDIRKSSPLGLLSRYSMTTSVSFVCMACIASSMSARTKPMPCKYDCTISSTGSCSGALTAKEREMLCRENMRKRKRDGRPDG